jgi:hypothetical protein
MKTRVYLLMTVILGIFSFSQSEARTMDHNAGAQVGPPSWSVTIPAKNILTIVKKGEEANSALGSVSTTRGRVSDNESPRPQDRAQSPKQDSNKQTKQGNTQSGDQGQIFDRWGNSKNKGTK